MNAARFESSARLRRLGKMLATKQWFTTLQLVRLCHVVAVNSGVAELRQQGWRIACRIRQGKDWRVFEYQAQKIPRKHLELL